MAQNHNGPIEGDYGSARARSLFEMNEQFFFRVAMWEQCTKIRIMRTRPALAHKWSALPDTRLYSIGHYYFKLKSHRKNNRWHRTASPKHYGTMKRNAQPQAYNEFVKSWQTNEQLKWIRSIARNNSSFMAISKYKLPLLHTFDPCIALEKCKEIKWSLERRSCQPINCLSALSCKTVWNSISTEK